LSVGIVIPVKQLKNAKTRLSTFLNIEERKNLVLAMLNDVLDAVDNIKEKTPIFVLSSDYYVLELAKNRGFHIIKESISELNNSIAKVEQYFMGRKLSSILTLMADLPLIKPSDIQSILEEGKQYPLVLCPSKRLDGTNAVLKTLPPKIPPMFGYNSFQQYIKTAVKKRLKYSVLTNPRISVDVDLWEDAVFVAKNGKETRTGKILSKAIIEQLN